MAKRSSTSPTEVDEVRGELLSLRMFDRGWCLASVRTIAGRAPITVVGSLIGVQVGDSVFARGTWEDHPKYGKRFKATDIAQDQPASATGVIGWLTSRLPDIGLTRARDLVARFGIPGIWQVIEGDADRLLEVKGITPTRRDGIVAAYHKHVAERDRIVRLKTWGLTDNQIGRVIDKWKDEAEETLRANPYRLAEEVDGFGFLRSDDIALRMGVKRDSPFRIRAGVVHMLGEASTRGHVYVPSGAIVKMTSELLGVAGDLVAAELGQVQDAGAAILSGSRVYVAKLHRAEEKVASALLRIMGNA